MDAIEEQVHRSKSARKKRTPPPVVILKKLYFFTIQTQFTQQTNKKNVYFGAQMEITKQNGGFRTSYNQNNEDQEQKSKHVICLMSPETNFFTKEN